MWQELTLAAENSDENERIVSRHQLAHALNLLLPPDLRKQNKALK
jgi:hypothetical protein